MRYMYLLLLAFVFTSCAKEFRNPYDPATAPEIWMPKAFKLDTLGINALRLSWNQDERHIDGFAIQKSTNGQLKEILLPLDSLRYTDTQAVDTSSDEVCPELTYKVMARAGNNRSLDIGTTSGIRMPLSTPAIAGTDILVTDTSTTVQLNAQAANAGERGQWSIISGSGGSFSNQNAHNSNFTGTPCTDYILRWTKTGCTETFDELNVKFRKSTTTANAGANQTITSNATQVTLSANSPAANETGTWSIVSGSGGSFSNVNSSTSIFNGSACSSYIIRWTISGPCSSSIDELNVNFQKATTTANAGSNQTITTNATQVTLAANTPAAGETGVWSIVSGSGGSFSNANSANSTFSGNACTSYSLRWTIQGICSSYYDDVSISFSQTNTIANAGVDQTITNNSTQVTLAANNPAAGESGTWSIVIGTGGSFSNINSSTSLFTGNACTSYTLRWTIGACISNFSDVVISFSQTNTNANAGADQTPTSLTTTLAANAVLSWENGLWSIVSGMGGAFSSANSPTATFTGLLGQSYTLKWSISSCINTSIDLVTIAYPISIAGSGVTDLDGNVYSTTKIGTQEWMGKNLRTSKYADGSTITYFTAWSSTTAPGYGYYNNIVSNNSVYGKLYNWYAAIDSRNVCPTGWHVPSKIEWDVLFNYLGSAPVGKLKETGTSHWLTPNTGATNAVNFTALPGGYSSSNDQGQVGYFMSTTASLTISHFAELERMNYDLNYRNNTQFYKNAGYSIRCLKN